MIGVLNSVVGKCEHSCELRRHFLFNEVNISATLTLNKFTNWFVFQVNRASEGDHYYEKKTPICHLSHSWFDESTEVEKISRNLF